eukprot:gb/GECH01009995.1/.p1 GENE.gb/GECH01009995.1/~~gb/GECH01009995.1/.p1  ORF type:complete len:164 (+),score=21.34 gb/GECH01009995.1/:1-492(+)
MVNWISGRGCHARPTPGLRTLVNRVHGSGDGVVHGAAGAVPEPAGDAADLPMPRTGGWISRGDGEHPGGVAVLQEGDGTAAVDPLWVRDGSLPSAYTGGGFSACGGHHRVLVLRDWRLLCYSWDDGVPGALPSFGPVPEGEAEDSSGHLLHAAGANLYPIRGP